MVGVVLFILILLFYGFILSTDLFRKIFQEDKNAQAKTFFDKWDGFFKSESARMVLAITGLTVGVWNFFAPNFGAGLSPSIIGAPIPSLILLLDSIVIFPSMLGIFNLPQETKDKISVFMDKYESIAGVLTILAGILHIAFYKYLLL